MLNKLVAFVHRFGFAILFAFHFFGVVMMAFYDLDLFASFTPGNLLLSAGLLFLVSHSDEWSKLARFFLASFFIGYLAELVGTQTGFPFGNYRYLPNLGPQLVGVPIIIGFNWFLIAYSAVMWVRQLVSNSIAQILLAAVIMVALDFLIEPLCETLGFWAWADKVAPWENYLGWLGVSIIIQWVFARLKIQAYNPLARWYFIMVALFFIMLNILL